MDDILTFMRNLDAIFNQNRQYAAPGPYNTFLMPSDEMMFRLWLGANQVPFNPDVPVQDYDMRGFWQAAQQRDPRATSATNPFDQQIHYPDFWKTPYHQTFSADSQWAKPGAPTWNRQGQLLDRSGRILFDESGK